jgi:hypothetical protein
MYLKQDGGFIQIAGTVVRERLTFIFPICKSIEKRIFILENIIVL